MPPTIRTHTLLLRTLHPDDADAITELAGARAVADTTATVPHPYSRVMAEQFIAWRGSPGGEELASVWAIERRADARFVGMISLDHDAELAAAEIGYWVGVPYWGQGIATEACRAVVDHGLGRLALARLYASHLTRNPASHRVLEKSGLRTEGVLRRAIRKWDRLEGLCHHSILPDEWLAAREGR
ncbi:MAG: GNAT family N-acetyltransferase [Chloroflexota bacterium]